jgi:hypothetical protein
MSMSLESYLMRARIAALAFSPRVTAMRARIAALALCAVT